MGETVTEKAESLPLAVKSVKVKETEAKHKQLLEYLASIHTGPILDTNKIVSLLAACWNEFAGSESEGMAAYILHNRVEDVRWDPPVLTFVVVRH